jgi:mRNA-degrading endonuclease RelE of RelBE toxin-antitoxin system
VPYRNEYSPDAEDHLRLLTARQQSIVLDTVDEQLAHEPLLETRNRKPMRPNPLAPWELRIGDLRVYYDVSDEAEPVVFVRAVGVKRRNQVRIGKEAIDL